MITQTFSPWRHPVAHLYNRLDPSLTVASPSLPPCSRSHWSSDEMTDKLLLGPDQSVLLSNAVMDLLLCENPHPTLEVQFCHICAHKAGPTRLWLTSTEWWLMSWQDLKMKAPTDAEYTLFTGRSRCCWNAVWQDRYAVVALVTPCSPATGVLP